MSLFGWEGKWLNSVIRLLKFLGGWTCIGRIAVRTAAIAVTALT